MKAVFIFLAIVFGTMNASSAQTIYNIPVIDIDGNSIEMSTLAMKKTLFIILPAEAGDSLNMQIDKFIEQYRDSINIVGILSEEEGIKEANKTAIKNRYGGRILLTREMRVKKTSADLQSPLLQWLTDKRKNRLSDKEEYRPGTKFFVSETGRLFAVFSRETSLQSPIINRIMSIHRIN